MVQNLATEVAQAQEVLGRLRRFNGTLGVLRGALSLTDEEQELCLFVERRLMTVVAEARAAQAGFLSARGAAEECRTERLRAASVAESLFTAVEARPEARPEWKDALREALRGGGPATASAAWRPSVADPDAGDPSALPVTRRLVRSVVNTFVSVLPAAEPGAPVCIVFGGNDHEGGEAKRPAEGGAALPAPPSPVPAAA